MTESESSWPHYLWLQAGFVCPLCGIVMKYKHNLQKHVREIHQGSQDYTCDVCGRKFSRKYNLQHHQMTVHRRGKTDGQPLSRNGRSWEKWQGAILRLVSI